MKNKWIIADLHFGHKNVIKYFNRPFSCVEEMNEILIQNWNKVVKSEDKIYVDGDISLARRYIKIMHNLNGHKILIKGNHDIFKLSDYLPHFEDIRSSMLVEENIIITHIPIFKGQSDRFIGNIHGHLHDERVLLPSGEIDPYYFNISVEQINYTPILLEEAIEKLKLQLIF